MASLKHQREIKHSDLDLDAFDRHCDFFIQLAERGYATIEVVEGAECFQAPKAFWNFCRTHAIEPHRAINMIVNDFITRLTKGNSAYNEGLLKRIKDSNKLSKFDKERILKILLTEHSLK